MAVVGSLNPVAIQQFFDANGDPLSGGKLYFFLAGTTTPSPVYTDQALTMVLPNPLVFDAAGRAPQHYLDALAYKEVLKDASDVTIWTVDQVTSPAALRNVGGTVTVSGLQHNLPVPQGLVTSLELRNTSLLTIDGFSGGTPGQLLLLRALGTARVDLVHTDGSTSAMGNQLINFVSNPTSMMPTSGAAVYVYMPPWWVMITHEQGKWIRVPFNASNFTVDSASAALGASWSVEAADIQQLDYKLQGTTLLITLGLANTTIVGTPDVLDISGWPYPIATEVSGGLPATAFNAAIGGYGPGLVNTFMPNLVRFSLGYNIKWTAGVNNTHLFAQLSLDVQ